MASDESFICVSGKTPQLNIYWDKTKTFESFCSELHLASINRKKNCIHMYILHVLIVMIVICLHKLRRCEADVATSREVWPFG